MLELCTKHGVLHSDRVILPCYGEHRAPFWVEVNLPTTCPQAELVKVTLEMSGILMILDAPVYRQSSANSLMLELVQYEHKGVYDHSLWYFWFDRSLTGTVPINNHSLRSTCKYARRISFDIYKSSSQIFYKVDLLYIDYLKPLPCDVEVHFLLKITPPPPHYTVPTPTSSPSSPTTTLSPHVDISKGINLICTLND